MVSTVLMLLIIVPVIGLTIYFAWRYRQTNKEANYSPDWDHSTELELAIWRRAAADHPSPSARSPGSAPAPTPSTPTARWRRIEPGRPVPSEVKPLTVEVVALDWKWLFIYPEQGIATVNELPSPVDRPMILGSRPPR